MLECANYLVRHGHEVHALASQWDDSSMSPGVIRHQVNAGWRPTPFELPAFVRASARVLRTIQPPPEVIASFGVAAPPQSVVWMTSVHAAWIEISRRTRRLGGRLKQWINPFHKVILRMEREMLHHRRYRKLLVLTPQMRTDLQRYYSVPPEDVVVLPNGYSGTEFNVERSRRIRADMRRRLQYADDHRVIVFVANEIERKGLVPLLRGVAQRQDPSLKILAVGRLDQGSITPEIRRLGLQERVQFTGPTSQTADYYAAADLFALPTKYEAWGLVIVEALACGLPVLTSRLAGAAVTIKEGCTGLLLDQPDDSEEIADKLGRLLNNGCWEADAIARSVQPFEWNTILAEYERILCDSASRPS